MHNSLMYCDFQMTIFEKKKQYIVSSSYSLICAKSSGSLLVKISGFPSQQFDLRILGGQTNYMRSHSSHTTGCLIAGPFSFKNNFITLPVTRAPLLFQSNDHGTLGRTCSVGDGGVSGHWCCSVPGIGWARNEGRRLCTESGETAGIGWWSACMVLRSIVILKFYF